MRTRCFLSGYVCESSVSFLLHFEALMLSLFSLIMSTIVPIQSHCQWVFLCCHISAYTSGDADLRRRRTIPEQPYGYANRPQMMNNYGGTMPQQTPYGYSGQVQIDADGITSYLVLKLQTCQISKSVVLASLDPWTLGSRFVLKTWRRFQRCTRSEACERGHVCCWWSCCWCGGGCWSNATQHCFWEFLWNLYETDMFRL